MRTRKWVVLAVEVAFLSLVIAAPARAGLHAKVVSPLVQVFPDAPPPGAERAQLEAARGEWEPFQVVVSGDAALSGVRARASTLVGGKGARIDPPALYRVEYLQVTTPSSVEGHAGPWPDALVPDVDRYVGETRRAFPFAVPKGQARAIWVDVFVPARTPPGLYRGDLTLEAAGQPPVKIPVELTVHGFVLPATSSLPVTFGFAASAVARAHGHPQPLAGPALAELVTRYNVAALRHRLSLHGGTFEPPPFVERNGRVELDFTAYDAEVGPFLDGTADRGGPAEGARFSTLDLRLPAKLEGAIRERYAKVMLAHLRDKGWLDRVFDYTFDEPADDKLKEARAKSERVQKVAPGVPRLITKILTPALTGAVDIWCPPVNYVDDKPGNSNAPPRADYDARLQKGEHLWWYQGCMSHGCEIVGGDYFTGWPSQVVDAPPVSHRIFEWLTWRYRIGGELYYNTVEAYARGLDPWRDQRLFGGNGDGTLFYPGDPQVIGGKTPIPVESIRMKLIREGLEDYEYLRLHEQRFGREATDAIARSIAPRTFKWQKDGARLLAARRQLAADLDRVAPLSP